MASMPQKYFGRHLATAGSSYLRNDCLYQCDVREYVTEPHLFLLSSFFSSLYRVLMTRHRIKYIIKFGYLLLVSQEPSLVVSVLH